ncbi:uncharacterized protein CXQ87_003240 [Candidozyma duobushaemuli]|uniref:Uncharacterized protein n=1 Tax=Candidozyma duobushaemuli TaxID=1231522 RepID=A0A2V1AEW0_9ASCO|nr:uncharacterized protein CXQ87_003240 [[Candida] duobushaemulonis]PVH15401.1 hypothetical protein CXQ87_003240 [[Candida] duobushaemulonis]
MSSRALRRLERQRESATPEAENDSDHEEIKKLAVNRFAFLGAESDDDAGNNDSVDEAEPEQPAPETPSISRKKNKKKNKKKKKQQQQQRDNSDKEGKTMKI